MTIENKITRSVFAAIHKLYGQEIQAGQIQLQATKKEFEGDLTLVVFPFLKISKKSPEETANDLVCDEGRL